MNVAKFLMIGGLVICGSTLVMAQGKDEHAMHATVAEKCPQFEALKSLAGTWKGKAELTDAPNDVEVSYAVTAAGSVVMETLFPGTDHEMVTMYHMDGKDLVLTHYCAAGNQPRMKLKVGGDVKVMKFEFAGGSNLDPAKDMHMHEATLTLKDADHMRAKWVGWAEGKEAHVVEFDLERQK